MSDTPCSDRSGPSQTAVVTGVVLALLAVVSAAADVPKSDATTSVFWHGVRVVILVAGAAMVFDARELRGRLHRAMDVARGTTLGEGPQSLSYRQMLAMVLPIPALVYMGIQREGNGVDEIGPLVLSLLLAAGLWVFLRHASLNTAVIARLTEHLRPTARSRGTCGGSNPLRSRWLWIGLVVLIIAGVTAEIRQPYYFTQDDNLVELLPSILFGCRTAFEGTFPAWNPYQFLGMPVAETATSALTYPPTYASYAVARFGLQNEYMTIEVFAWSHILIGFIGCFWLGRRLGIGDELSAALGVCFVLSGFVLIAGRSWYMMTPTFAWMPVLGALMMDLGTGRIGIRWVLAVAIAIGLLAHAGHAQMWLYAFGYVALWCLWCVATKQTRRSDLLKASAAMVIGAGIAALVFVPQFVSTREYGPATYGGFGVLVGLDAILFPWPFAAAPHPFRWGSVDVHLMGQLYYAGTVLTCGWLGALALGVTSSRALGLLLRSPLLPLSIVALVFSLGDDGVLWATQHSLPVLSGLRGPFRHLPF
ncbi:MAG: hypothetical protein GF393_10885, partial [Armatimonadia bacterium]|nr:hypothetical protein [Armatimonadia bacterium]